MESPDRTTTRRQRGRASIPSTRRLGVTIATADGTDLSNDDWEIVPLALPTLGRPKWKRRTDGSVAVAAAGNDGGSLFVTSGSGWADCRFQCTVDRSDPTRGEVGVVLGYASLANHYAICIDGGEKPAVQLVRVRDGRATPLAKVALDRSAERVSAGLRPIVRAAPVRIGVSTTTIKPMGPGSIISTIGPTCFRIAAASRNS